MMQHVKLQQRRKSERKMFQKGETCSILQCFEEEDDKENKEDDDKENKEDLSVGAIVGISVGSLCLCVACYVIMTIRTKRNKRNARNNEIRISILNSKHLI